MGFLPVSSGTRVTAYKKARLVIPASRAIGWICCGDEVLKSVVVFDGDPAVA